MDSDQYVVNKEISLQGEKDDYAEEGEGEGDAEVKPQTLNNPKPSTTPNPEQTQTNPKRPQTRNPKPLTQNPKP